MNRNKSPSFKIGNSERKSVVEKVKRDMPGPGNYS